MKVKRTPHVGKLTTAFLIGRLILERITPQSAETTIWPLLLGIVVYTIVSAVVVLIGLGAVWLLVHQQREVAASPAP